MNGQKNATELILLELVLPNLAATVKFASRFAPLLKSGDVVALDGSLGAGKTELCRAIIHGLGVLGDVPSPTFTLLQIYDTPSSAPVWHLDLYRLEQPEEAFELGIEEGFDEAISLIEWPSKLGPYLPAGFLTFRLEIAADGNARELTVIGDEVWKKRLEGIGFED
ncbi:MAG: tRNA (adenosine(37)-N6)-threonylcarbamoyltransferase complex ATPase subunit type 1 TsaE [Emcibacter sp.]|nr:tRNA (adenosine(37)-N6)-threonylcarbamoyltransferase complex ATPase subunit type 1 TsaE [Emcibacter sp.]